jgi:carboxylesterase
MQMDPNLIKPLKLYGGRVGCLLIHGFTSCPLDLRPLTEHLHRDWGFTAHEILLPGHGTTFEDMARFGWADWIRACEKGLGELKKQCDQVWLIGFSMGGVLANIVASRHQVEGLVSISAPIWPQKKITKYAFLLKYFRKHVEMGKRPDFEVPSWRYNHVSMKSIADLSRLINECKQALSRVQVPALVVQGDSDRTVEPRSADYIFKALGSADKEFFFTSGGHMLLLESRRQEICCRISEFIKTRTGGISNGCNQAGR